MSSNGDANFDTSVLVNYVYTKLPGTVEDDNESVRLLEDSGLNRVIGGKAKGEFTNLCDRREVIYDDLLDWLEDHPEFNIYEYDVSSRPVSASDNDTDHVRFDIQCGWGEEPRRKQLSDFRRLSQGIDTIRRDIIRKFLDGIYPQFSNSELSDELGDLDLGHDTQIVIDAVEIHREDSIDLLVGSDNDLTSNEIAINNRISSAEDQSLELRILEPSDV